LSFHCSFVFKENIMTNKLITLIACALIIGAVMGCTKKEDPAIAALQAQMEAMQAELEKARSGNASAEEIAQLETAVAEIAEQEQRAERRRGEGGRRNRDETTAPDTASSNTTPSTSTTTTTPAASTSTTTSAGGFQMSGTMLEKYTGTSASVTIPNNVARIWESAFYGTSITSVTIPASVTGIDGNPFVNSANLTSITVDSGNPNYASEGGILYNKAKTEIISVPKRISGNVTIPNGITSIGRYDFQGCAGITGITIPNSVTTIGQEAFQGCTSLTSITIPNGVTSIEKSTFSNCTKLTSVTIGNGVTSIGDTAFFSCTSLTSVTIPNRVTSIGARAFEGCSGLTRVGITGSVTSMGERAFYACTSLTSISISSTNIGVRAFDNCTSLAEVIIGSDVTSIGSEAFANCNNLTSVMFMGMIPVNGFAYRALPGNLQDKYFEYGGGQGLYGRQPGSSEWERMAIGA
jgi:hypothetical protein